MSSSNLSAAMILSTENMIYLNELKYTKLATTDKMQIIVTDE